MTTSESKIEDLRKQLNKLQAAAQYCVDADVRTRLEKAQSQVIAETAKYEGMLKAIKAQYYKRVIGRDKSQIIKQAKLDGLNVKAFAFSYNAQVMGVVDPDETICSQICAQIFQTTKQFTQIVIESSLIFAGGEHIKVYILD